MTLIIITIVVFLAVAISNENVKVSPYQAVARPRDAAPATAPRVRITPQRKKMDRTASDGGANQLPPSTSQQQHSVYRLLKRLTRYAQVVPSPQMAQGLQAEVEVRRWNPFLFFVIGRWTRYALVCLSLQKRESSHIKTQTFKVSLVVELL